MEEELNQLRDKTNHCLSKLEGTMSISAEVESLHDFITGKNELIKSRGKLLKT